MYKIWWTFKFKDTEDGYFYKTVEFHKGFKYVADYFDAKDLIDKVNNAIMLLGMTDIAEVGMEKEE